MDDKYGFAARFREMSDEKLIEAFNREVGNSGWVNARAEYLSKLHEEFKVRGYDYSAIGNDGNLSFAHKIGLFGKTIVIL